MDNTQMSFDKERLMAEFGISAERFEEIERMVSRDYPDDPMLFELHVLRAIRRERYTHLHDDTAAQA